MNATASHSKPLNHFLMPPSPPVDFAAHVVQWQQAHGRHDLPWQENRHPYCVWVSEIMLQQTQVSTVKSYFLRFMERLPTVHTLAAASTDEVLALWSGLGYYSRARNLHLTAQIISTERNGIFPQSAAELEKLPGIGPSTACAISSICFGERATVFDGNVQRVISRYFAFSGDLAKRGKLLDLWKRADELLPAPSHALEHMPIYTQGMMDLGAKICLQKKPVCSACPINTSCQAFKNNEVECYPVKSKKITRKKENMWLLWITQKDGKTLLEKRSNQGIWAGLYTFLSVSDEPTWRSTITRISNVQQLDHVHKRQDVQFLAPVKHVLTHRDLYLHVAKLVLSQNNSTLSSVLEPSSKGQRQWIDQNKLNTIGLAKPFMSWLKPSL